MAFGKKKAKKQEARIREEQIKAQMVELKKNPLYPPKQENTFKEVMMALGTVVVCLALVGVIFMNFSYAVRGYDESYGTGTNFSETDEHPEESTSDDGTTDEQLPSETEEPNMEEEPEESVLDSDYIIPDSDSRFITSEELDQLTKEELSYARNEIYARHGRLFKDETIQSYFDSKDWYVGTVPPESFTQDMLNDYEIDNAETILAYEKAKGYR